MDIFSKITSKLSKEIMEPTLPDECKLYFHYVQYHLEGFDFKNDILNTAIRVLKDEYTYYQNNKDTHDLKTATSKYDENTFAKDFMNKRNSYDCAKALSFLLMYHIVTYYRYSYHGHAFEVFKKHIIQEIKNMDREKIPESFFCHYRADEIFQDEENLTKKYLDLTQKYSDLYQEYLKLLDFPDDEDY